ncbi:hypothetical protein F5Y10DRAFT_46386 [Nemania abortiva]|nr:hypothetical protein F5Y10DRAFT_46386 [Nemania abortiva]
MPSCQVLIVHTSLPFLFLPIVFSLSLAYLPTYLNSTCTWVSSSSDLRNLHTLSFNHHFCQLNLRSCRGQHQAVFLGATPTPHCTTTNVSANSFSLRQASPVSPLSN